MKKGLFLLTVFLSFVSTGFAYNYDTNLPLPGKTIADEQLQKDSLFTIYMFAHRIAKPDCKDFSIIDTNISSDKVDNKWEEIWTIKACTRVADVPITFETKESGSTYAIGSMGVRVTENEK